MAFPPAIIYRAPELLADPHYKAREALIKVDHPEHENFVMQNVTPKLSATLGEVEWIGPALGQHNEAIYGELLGMNSATRADLEARGVI